MERSADMSTRRPKTVAQTQCKSCPFRGADKKYERECAGIPAEHWPCHTEDLVFGNIVQCHGHWKAQQKYPNEPHPAPFAGELMELFRA